MADDGTPQLLVRCRQHDPPVEQLLDDPEAPAPPKRKSSTGGGDRDEPLVHQLGLYDKLAEVIEQFDQPVEYGVVEYHFAYAHPEDYLKLYREFGHVHKDGPRKYSLSSYLSRLLGNLSRQDRVVHHPSVGTGRWAYNQDLSAWSPPGDAAGRPIRSWEDFARANDLDPEIWPALELLDEDEAD
ncbi:MAG: hypothetical protein R3320_04990 [Nitriliruptorales bacterium]|nr:hypothetical protein [Nitriliruptorales bacterium]